jgi:transposase
MKIERIIEIVKTERINKKLSFQQISKMANMPTSTVNHFFSENRKISLNNFIKIANSLGFELIINKKKVIVDLEKIVIDLYLENLSYKDICNKLSISEITLTNMLHKLKKKGILKNRKKIYRGTQHKREYVSKMPILLSEKSSKKHLEEHEKQILEMFEQGLSQTVILMKLGFPKTDVFRKNIHLILKKNGRI